MPTKLTVADRERVVEMAWEDRTPFEAIEAQFHMSESDVVALMRRQLKPGSFRLWRERVRGRDTKHAKISRYKPTRHVCPTQYKHRSSL